MPGAKIDGQNADVILNAEHERLGQDLVLNSPGINGKEPRKLIQFKYSANPQKHKLGLAEWLEILESLRQSEEAANKIKKQPTAFVLITNRPNSSSVKSTLEDLQARKSSPKLEALNRKKGGSIKDQARRTAIALELQRILADWSTWDDLLQDHATRYGLLDDELKRGVDVLISRLLASATDRGASSLNADELNLHLVGWRKPGRLLKDDVKSKMQEGLDHFQREIRCDKALVRRNVLDEIGKAMNVPLIILTGQGGCGKSTAVYQLLSEFLGGQSTPRHYVFASSAVNLPKEWVCEIVTKLRKRPTQGAGETQEWAFERLCRAHSEDPQPVLILVLDAVDEIQAYPIQ